MSFFKVMYITNDTEVALIAEKYGVDRIWIDLEKLGKQERQGHLDTVKSEHTIEDIKKIASVLSKSELLVRINPINKNTEKEINQVIEAGAQIIMLPMWKSVQDVKDFLKFVNKRVKTILLLETKEAVECLDEVLEYGGFNEIHLGLNDLHLSYNLNFMFELLTNGLVEQLCNKLKKYGIPYGFGGIAKLGEGLLPAEKIIMEHYRLESTRVILSRGFCKVEKNFNITDVELLFKYEMKKLRNYENEVQNSSEELLVKNKKNIKVYVDSIVKDLKEKKSCN